MRYLAEKNLLHILLVSGSAGFAYYYRYYLITMAPTMIALRKVVTAKEIKSGRIALPAGVRDRFFPHVAENSKTPVIWEDENGDTHDIVVKVRDNGIKPEIMARGGRMLVQKRGLSPGDALVFLEGGSGGRIRFKVERRARLAPPARLGAFGFLNGFAQAPFFQEPPPPPPLPETVAFGFGMSIRSNDHVPPATENLAWGLGLSMGSVNEPVELPNATVVELGLSIGSGHAAARPPPVLPVVPQLGLSSGSDHSRLTVELSLSIGSGRHGQIEPLEALPMTALSSSAGETIKRVKLEVQQAADDGPTLELTLGLGSSPPPPAVILQDQRTEERTAVKLSLSDNYFSPKPGSSKLMIIEQELKPMKQPHGTLFLDPAHPEAAYSREMQEPKPPTPLIVPASPAACPAGFDFLGLYLSHVPPEPIPKPLEELIVPGATVLAKAKALLEKAFVDPKVAAAAAGGSCGIDFSTPYNEMLGQPAGAGML